MFLFIVKNISKIDCVSGCFKTIALSEKKSKLKLILVCADRTIDVTRIIQNVTSLIIRVRRRRFHMELSYILKLTSDVGRRRSQQKESAFFFLYTKRVD